MPEPLGGRVCPMDQTPLVPTDEIVACSKCQTLHHAKCWRENRNCTTLDCPGTSLRVVVALETSVDVKNLNTELQSLRSTVSDHTRRLERMQKQELGVSAKATAELGDLLRSAMSSHEREARSILAGLADLVLRIRSLDYSVTRHRYPPEAAAPRRAPAVAPKDEGVHA